MKQVNQSSSLSQIQINQAIESHEFFISIVQLCQFIRDYKLKNEKKIKQYNLTDRIKVENIPNFNLEALTVDYLGQLNISQFQKIQNQLQKTVDMLMEQEFAIDRDYKNQKNQKQVQLNESFQSQYSSVNNSYNTDYSSVRRHSTQQYQNDFFRQKNFYNEENYNSKRCLDGFSSSNSKEVFNNNIIANNQLKSIDNLYQKKQHQQQINILMNDSLLHNSQPKTQNYSSQFQSVNQSRRVSVVKINDVENSDNDENEQEQQYIQTNKEDALDKLLLKVNEEREKMLKLIEKEKKERQNYLESQEFMNYQSNRQIDYSEQLYIKEQQIVSLAKEVNQLKQENFNLKNSILQLKKDKTDACPNKNNAFSYVMQNCQILSSQENTLIFKWAFESQIDLCKLLQSAICIQAEKEKGQEAKQIEQFYQSIIHMENFEQLLETQDQVISNTNTQEKQHNLGVQKSNENIQNHQIEIQELKSQLNSMKYDLNQKDNLIDQLHQQIQENALKFSNERQIHCLIFNDPYQNKLNRNKYQNEMKYIKRQQRELEIQQSILKLEREKFEQEQNEKKQLEELEKMQNDLSLLSQF